jgi:hypothetical protein
VRYCALCVGKAFVVNANRLRWLSLTAVLCAAMSAANPVPAPQFRGSRPGATNTCKCDPPINSQATATGTCTRTQDDGTFCDLTFSVSRRAELASRSMEFKKYAAQANLSVPSDQVGSLVAELESGDVFSRTPEAVAESLQAIAAVAAIPRNDDATQNHFRDIFDLLTFNGSIDQERKAAVIRSLQWFSSPIEKGPKARIEKALAKDKKTFEIVTTPGCIAFGESNFTFMVRVLGESANCDIPR